MPEHRREVWPESAFGIRNRATNDSLARLLAALFATGALLVTGTASASASSPTQIRPGAPGGQIAHWRPAYTQAPELPEYDSASSVAFSATGMWLSTEATVSHFSDGVWSTPESPPGVGAIFTVAEAPDGLWAFGFEGESWRRTPAGWSAVPRVTGADLYDSAVSGGQVAAVGFDYGTEYGTIMLTRDGGVTAVVYDWLFRRQLFAVGAAPDGTLWAGGCDYQGNLFMMRRAPLAAWEPVAAPVTTGCLYDVSFAADGTGLAAASHAVLAWDGASWRVIAERPADERVWVRVGATDDDPADPQTSQPSVTGWALAARTRWPTYVDAQMPLYFDGGAWIEPEVGPAAVDVLPMEGRAFVALASDGSRAITLGQVEPGTAALREGTAALMDLTPARIELGHPLLTTVEDLNASGDELWAGGHGASGLIHRTETWTSAGEWAPASTRRVDFAEQGDGWALGAFQVTDPVSATFEAAAYWDGSAWSLLPNQADASVRDIGALPDGRVWGRSYSGLLVERTPERGWRPVGGAPTLAAAPGDGSPGTPFDVVGLGPRTVGWVGGANGLHRYEDGRFERPPMRIGQIRVVDLVMTDWRSGWALAYGDSGGGGVSSARELFRLADGEWNRIQPPPLPYRDLDWLQMASDSSREVWLLGTGRLARGMTRQLLVRYDGRWSVFGEETDESGVSELTCSATRLAVRTEPFEGSDVWLGGTSAPCGPTDGDADPGADFAGPVSVLRVSPVRSSLHLPAVRR